MKHLAKDIFLECDGDYSFVLKRKLYTKTGKKKGDAYYEIIGYFSNMERVRVRLKDLGYMEWVNGDLEQCKKFIEQAYDRTVQI